MNNYHVIVQYLNGHTVNEEIKASTFSYAMMRAITLFELVDDKIWKITIIKV